MAKPHGLPKAVLLRSRNDIQAVFSSGHYHRLGLLHAKCLPTQSEDSRFLISVKKAIGNAPRRNRIKRLVKEAIRIHRRKLNTVHDICFFLTKPPPEKLTLSMIEAELLELFRRIEGNG